MSQLVVPTIKTQPRRPLNRVGLGGFVGSLSLHLFALALSVVALPLASDDATSFEGRQRVISLEASLLLPSDESNVVELETALPVVITPHRAQIEDHQFTPSETITDFSPEMIFPALMVRSETQLLEQPVEIARETSVLPRTPPASIPSPSQSATPPSALGTDDLEPPVFADNQPPMYPDLARRNRWQGTVTLRLKIAADGFVTEVSVATSSGYEVLDAQAVNAVRQWRAKPALRGGRPTASEELLPVRFRLD